MSQIVAIPVTRISAKVALEKGRGWSAVDELVLWALSRTPMSAAALAEKSRLPRRVIIEIIVRMMRFRLVEAVLVDGMPAFQTTDRGSMSWRADRKSRPRSAGCPATSRSSSTG